jgi:hypothetical protein
MNTMIMKMSTLQEIGAAANASVAQIILEGNIRTAMQECIPKSCVREKRRPAWITNDLVTLFREKEKAYKKCVNKCSPKLKSDYMRLRKQVKKMFSLRRRCCFIKHLLNAKTQLIFGGV